MLPWLSLSKDTFFGALKSLIKKECRKREAENNKKDFEIAHTQFVILAAEEYGRRS